MAASSPDVGSNPQNPAHNRFNSGRDTQRPESSRIQDEIRFTTPTTSSSQPSEPHGAAGHAESPTSPLTGPVARSRGFSLRRNVFAMNISRTQPSGIELSARNSKSPAQGDIEEKSVVQRKGFRDAIFSSPQYSDSSLNTSKDLPSTSVIPRDGFLSQHRHHVSNLKSSFTKLIKVITGTQDLPPTKDGRHIELNPLSQDDPIDERTGKAYISNTITSSRYTIWNFLPRQLIFQFSRVSNFYFLCIAVLQLTGFSTTGTYSTLVPLMAFVSIAMAKEGFDDYRRHILDRVENRNTVDVLRVEQVNYDEGITESDGARSWIEVKWAAVKIGDIIRLRRDDAIPADLVLLYSNGPSGMAYIDTAALDGESNLKARQASPLLRKICRNEDDITHCQAHIVLEDPNLDLYNFDGRITVGEETLPLTGNEVIYRGSVLRNTIRAFGMVINTGEECKIRMNATKNPKAKAPSMQRIVNQVVVIIAIFVLVLTGLNNAAYGVWKTKQENKSWYLTNASIGRGALFASSFVMFSTMIPLALYISLEIVKVGQMYLLGDIDMYDAESNTPMEPRTNTINEELGQITHVFSDKTGTLTENIMRFRKMSVAGAAWLHDFDLKKEVVTEQNAERKSQTMIRAEEVATTGHERQRSDIGSLPSYSHVSERTESALVAGHGSLPRLSEARTRRSMAMDTSQQDSNSEPTSRELVSYLQHKPDSPFSRKARFFLLAMALCHTALPEIQADGLLDYQAMSPDELALVRAAKDMGFMVVDRASQSITIVTREGEQGNIETRETYEVLDVVEFSSRRKRMSILIRFPNGKICLFCKGADSTIIKRLKSASGAVQMDAEIRKSITSKRRSEAQEELRRQSQDSPRNSLSRPSFGRSRNQLGRPSFISRRSTGEVRSSIEILGRVLHADSPRVSMAASRRSSAFGNLMIDQSIASDDSAILDVTLRHIHDFATEGLRTLMYGYKWLEEEEYRAWKKLFHAASTSLVNRQELINQASETLEQDLDLAGATAIEDELQEGVPETIDKLRRAGMSLWMLTGDKRETAINIGHSCKLIKTYSEVVVLDSEKSNVDQVMRTSLLDIEQGDIAHSVIVVDGQTLSDIEVDQTLSSAFFKLVIAADSVICCRASPTQKAFLVKTIRQKVKGSVTLAVGDSANDIAMIQEAHVGIGISGKEGMQAARTSDYSIGQFRFLQKLLLVHGRWNYVRTGKYILGTFW
jgi:phospholipid-translocating ATPase